MTSATPARTGPPFRLSLRGSVILIGILGLVLVYATDQILPATTDRQAELRFWMAARATGIVAFLLLTLQVVLGLVLSHPTNRSTWNLSKRIFPWHDHLWVFVMAFLIVHVVSLVIDPKSGVSLGGALVPGLVRVPQLARGDRHVRALRVPRHRGHRPLDEAAAEGCVAPAPSPRAARLRHGLDARRPCRHRLVDARSRSTSRPGLLVAFAGAYRYWASRKRKPTFTTSRPEVPSAPSTHATRPPCRRPIPHPAR